MYVMRTIPGISPLFKPLEDAIYLKLIHSLTGHSCSASEHEVLSLPCRLGGLGIVNPTIIADSQFDASTKITNPLKNLIYNSLWQQEGICIWWLCLRGWGGFFYPPSLCYHWGYGKGGNCFLSSTCWPAVPHTRAMWCIVLLWPGCCLFLCYSLLQCAFMGTSSSLINLLMPLQRWAWLDYWFWLYIYV